MKKKIRQLMLFVESREGNIVLALALLVIVAGSIYSFYLGDNIRYSDENEYYSIAKNIASQKMYSVDGIIPTASRPPVYPILLSFIIYLGGTIPHIRLLNYTALGFSIYLLYLIVKNQSSSFAGLISAVLVICYPVLFYSASVLLTEIVGSLLFLMILYMLAKTKPYSIKPYILIGLMFGCLILTVPYFIFSLLVTVLWVMFSRDKGSIKASIAIFLIAFTVIGLWSVRNYYVFNSFVFISTHGARAFYHGNFKGTTANPVSKTDYLIPAEVYANLNEIELAAYFKAKAIKDIVSDKKRAVKLYFLKVLNYFNYHNVLSSNEESYVSKFKDIIMLLTYGPLFFLLFLRLLFIKKYKPSRFEVLLITLYFSNAFFMGIFLTRIRYRLPFDFLMIAIVSIFLYNLSVETKSDNV